jgi:hypothetical protein
LLNTVAPYNVTIVRCGHKRVPLLA